MTKKFEIFVTYSQIAVFNSDLADPFNDWNDVHVAQGFSWRPGSVSFGTLDEGGPMDVSVAAPARYVRQADAIRIIKVPFTVGPEATIEIASISDSQALSLNPGDCSIVFETGRSKDGRPWCRFSFLPEKSSEAEILLADSELSPPKVLLMKADPAG